MTKRIRLNVNLPFDGFYGSWYGDALDTEETQWVEYEETERETGEIAHPPELRLNGQELAELLMRHTDYGKAQRQIAEDYVEAFNEVASEALGLSLGLTFEAMVSPRYYNFSTDRVFADIDLKVMRELFRQSAAENHETLAGVIKGRFTSYDGFSSFYETDLAVWLAKPLRDWDHNELGTLLVASLVRAGIDQQKFRSEVYDEVGHEAFYYAWEGSVDWPAFEKARDEVRQSKLDDLSDTDPDLWKLLTAAGEVPCVRCPETLDLFDASVDALRSTRTVPYDA